MVSIFECFCSLKGSKKRIKWIFGYADSEEEQEVVLVHSLVSGKKVITVNLTKFGYFDTSVN